MNIKEIMKYTIMIRNQASSKETVFGQFNDKKRCFATAKHLAKNEDFNKIKVLKNSKVIRVWNRWY